MRDKRTRLRFLMNKLIRIEEPLLLFGRGQTMEDPRDGLTLFGPLDQVGRPYGVRMAVIGTPQGIDRFTNWVSKIHRPVALVPPSIARPPFPGFEAVFNVPWSSAPTMPIEVDEKELRDSVLLDDPHQRVFKTVGLYASRITETLTKEECAVDIWFVVIPTDVYKYCRPRISVSQKLAVKANMRFSPGFARKLKREPSFFNEWNRVAEAYQYEVNFHNQLKAKLLSSQVPTQIVREKTIAFREFVKPDGRLIYDLTTQESAIAWNLASAVYYKVGGRPWKLATVREGVCYLGMVFKQDALNSNKKMACCAAQMFLDSGDGVVFKGAVGPWYSPRSGEYHLEPEAAFTLVSMAITEYEKKTGQPPKELFIHGRIAINREEWESFKKAAGSFTKVFFIQIRKDYDSRLYRLDKHTVLRGTALILNERAGILWTMGFVPRLLTYPGREIPVPLSIRIINGEADIETVMGDIMALTKLNYNACTFADSEPVTLKFANSVGEILTAGPLDDVPPLAFKYYI